MTSKDLREKYLSFFEKKGHKRIDPAPLVLEDDPTTLFTSAGMQPLVPYLKGKSHKDGTKLVNSQPCFRSQDIDEVGDNRHTTFFEMLGNWSLGGYEKYKEDQLRYFFNFLTNDEEGLGLNPERLYVSCFAGEEEFSVLGKNGEHNPLGPDVESVDVWQRLFEESGVDSTIANIATKDEPDIKKGRIFYYEAKKNWWSLSGTPSKMLIGDIGGPDSEVFYDFGEHLELHEKSQWKDGFCHPNCDCGRFLEIGNSVFIQYKKIDERTFEELPQKNVDFGGGLERLVAAVNNDPDVFKIELFLPLIEKLALFTGKLYGEDPKTDKNFRIICDHVRASAFLIKAGVIPSNKLHGYTLRRLIRGAAVKLRQISGIKLSLIQSLTSTIIGLYEHSRYFTYKNTHDQIWIADIVFEELQKFEKTLNRGLKEIEKVNHVDGKIAFDLYQSYGFPLELTEELFREKGQEIDHKQFEEEFDKHRELSRTASAGMFKGGLAGDTPEMRKLHTTAHLLQASLRKVLGEHVEQAGQNITDERLRFDFKHNEPVSDRDRVRVEQMINEQIDKDLPVSSKVMSLDEAYKQGALGFFKDKYGEQVSVYTVGDPDREWFSKEVCGGPHVTHTGEIGHVTISKEESAGSGVRRIYIKLQ